MNDIQENERIFAAATSETEKQTAVVSKAAEQLALTRKNYLQSVIRAATLSEETRRKKDSLANKAILGGLAVLTVILFIVALPLGIVFLTAAFSIFVLKKSNDSSEYSANYNKRKAFFTKYAYAIPPKEQLRWKDTDDTYSEDFGSSATGEWSCPECGFENSASSKFCMNCGKKKP